MIGLVTNLAKQLTFFSRRHVGALIPVILVSIYVFSFEFNGLLDMPNHMARSYIMKTCFLDSTNPLCTHYIVSFKPSTFILSDLTLVGYLLLFPPLLAEKIALFSLLSLFIIAWYVLYRRINGTANTGYLAGLLLVLSNYMYSGFYAYILSIVAALFWLYFWWGVKDDKTILNQVSLSLAMALIFAIHLAGFLFVFMVYILYEIQNIISARSVSLKRVLANVLKRIPVVVMFFVLLLAQGFMDRGHSSAISKYATAYRSFINKVSALAFPFVNYSRIDLIVIVVVFIVLVFSINPSSYRRIFSNFWAKASILFFISFMITPVEINHIYDFDVRFLPIAYLAAFIAIGDSARRVSFYSAIICIMLLVSFATSMYYKNATNQQLMKIYDIMNSCRANNSMVEINSIRNYPDGTDSRVSPFPNFSQYHVFNGGSFVGGLFNCKFNKNISYFCYADNDVAYMDYYKFQFQGIAAINKGDLIKLAEHFDYVLLIARESEDYILSKMAPDLFTMVKKNEFVYLFKSARSK